MPVTVKHALSVTVPDAALEKRRASWRRWYDKSKERRLPQSRECALRWARENPERHTATAEAWRKANPERVRANKKAWYSKNKERLTEQRRAFAEENRARLTAAASARYAQNKEKYQARYKAWSQANPHKEAARTAKRRAIKQRATPLWADLSMVDGIYLAAKTQSIVAGVPYEVDHIVPLRGRNVCGLHWEGNLQILTATENMKKGNKCL